MRKSDPGHRGTVRFIGVARISAHRRQGIRPGVV